VPPFFIGRDRQQFATEQFEYRDWGGRFAKLFARCTAAWQNPGDFKQSFHGGLS
jgi:hypothetical protein